MSGRHVDEAELRRHGRCQAGAWERGARRRRRLRRSRPQMPRHHPRPLVTKLLLGHAIVLEALLPRAAFGMKRSRWIRADEAELRRQLRSQTGAWERGKKARGGGIPGSARVPRAGEVVPTSRTSERVGMPEARAITPRAGGKFVAAGRRDQHAGRARSPEFKASPSPPGWLGARPPAPLSPPRPDRLSARAWPSASAPRADPSR